MRIAVFGNVFQQKKSASVRNLLALLQKEGDEILIDEAFHSYLQNELRLDVPPCQIIRGEAFRADVAVSMGGDGTFLEAARRVGDKEIPILGVNMGRLGYLSDFSPEEMEQALRRNNFSYFLSWAFVKRHAGRFSTPAQWGHALRALRVKLFG